MLEMNLNPSKGVQDLVVFARFSPLGYETPIISLLAHFLYQQKHQQGQNLVLRRPGNLIEPRAMIAGNGSS